jgi:hypothetical protein
MYPSMDKAVLSAFKSFISKRVGDKMKIVASSEINQKLLNNSYIPNSPVSQLIDKLQSEKKKKDNYYDTNTGYDDDREYYSNDRSGIMSYQDTYIPVSKRHKKLHLKEISKKKGQLYNEISGDLNRICGKMKVSQFKKELRPALQLAFTYYRYEFVNLFADLANVALDKSREESFDENQFVRNYYKFLLFESDKFINQNKRRIISYINGAFKNKADKFRAAHFNAVINLIRDELTPAIKEKMMVAYRVKSKALPLP